MWLHSRPDIENYMEENLIQDRYNSLFIRHPHVHFIGEAEVCNCMWGSVGLE